MDNCCPQSFRGEQCLSFFCGIVKVDWLCLFLQWSLEAQGQLEQLSSILQDQTHRPDPCYAATFCPGGPVCTGDSRGWVSCFRGPQLLSVVNTFQAAFPDRLSPLLPWSPCCRRRSTCRGDVDRRCPRADHKKQKALSLCSQENNMKQDEGFGLDLFCFGAFQGARHAVVFGLGRKG